MKKHDPQMVFAVTLLAILLLSNLLAPVLAPYDPNATDMAVRLQGPSVAHPLGTDALGWDLFSRVLYGGRASILVALAATALSMAFGCTLMAPHGGIFVFPVVENPLMYLISLVAGTVIGALLLGVLKKKAEA